MMHNTLEMLTKIIDKPEDAFLQFFEYDHKSRYLMCNANYFMIELRVI